MAGHTTQLDAKTLWGGKESPFQTSYGKLMILVSSDVDEDYKQKYDNHIKALIDGALQTLKDTLVCADADIQKFETTEVINLFDFNLDGVLVNYNVILND